MNKKQFINLLVESLEAIEELYRIPYDTRPYERIICYEFYHQLRERIREDCPFVLHGELDKRYRDKKKVPDFVFHVPRTDARNFAVIEFKNVRSGTRWIKYDLRKLDEFRNHPYHYQIGILIVFGNEGKLTRVREKLRLFDQTNSELDILFYDLHKGKVTSQLLLPVRKP